MLRIEVKDASVERATVNGPRGQFTSERQAAWTTLPSGETRKIRLSVRDGKVYGVGQYTLSDDSFTVGQYGDLELLRTLVLLPVASGGSAK